jgi:hypothetical protein
VRVTPRGRFPADLSIFRNEGFRRFYYSSVIHERKKMPRVSLNQPAPDFNLPDFTGKPFQLSGLHGQKNVLLVFNRTFT